MENSQLKERILSLVPEAEIVETKQYLNAIIPKEKLHFLAKNLREAGDTSFDYLFCLTGLDLMDSLMVVYHIESTKYHHCIVLKTSTTDRDKPVLDSVTDIWHTADYHEREVFDFFGIKFNNHPDMRRLFLDETRIEGFPFRKDYVDEINIVER